MRNAPAPLVRVPVTVVLPLTWALPEQKMP